MKLGLAAPTDLVSLAGLAALKGIRVDGKALVIGAGDHPRRGGRLGRGEEGHPRRWRRWPAHIGDPQVRNRGTLGGSLAHNDPSADYPAAVLALGATIQTDRRTIAADAFFKGLYQTALEPDEVITAVRFPIPEKAAYAKFPHPASKFALVGRDGGQGAGRRARGGHRRRARRLPGAPSWRRRWPRRFAAEALAGVTVSAAGLNADGFGSAEYRAHLVGVMARRAVAACG